MSTADDIIVAVDGGASRCRLVAFDPQGARVAEVQIDAHASLSLGINEAHDHIRNGLAEIASELQQGPNWWPRVLSMGLAGSLQSERSTAFLKLIPETVATLLVTDGVAQLQGASGDEPGICLAVGTGSVIHWKDAAGAIGMAGGWGFPAGDEASGAWLGLSLLQRYLWHRDGDICDSPLMSVVESTTGTSVSDIQRWTTTGRSRDFAQMAPSIAAAAEHGDSLAVELLQRGVVSLERLLSCAPSNLPVYLVGGLADVYRRRLGARFAKRLQPVRGDAFDGLYQPALTVVDKTSGETSASVRASVDKL